MHRIRDDSRAAIIQPKKGSGACFRVSREIVRRADAVQRLNEIGYRFAVGLFGDACWQNDKKLIRAISMSAIELQVRGDVRGRFAETPRGAHHFAGDSVNLIRRETLVRLALATPGKKGHY